MGINGEVHECPTAKIMIWLPGKQLLTHAEMLIGTANTSILGFDLLVDAYRDFRKELYRVSWEMNGTLA